MTIVLPHVATELVKIPFLTDAQGDTNLGEQASRGEVCCGVQEGRGVPGVPEHMCPTSNQTSTVDIFLETSRSKGKNTKLYNRKHFS